MIKYLSKKMLEYFAILFIVSFIMFFMIHLSPTDPVAVIIGGKASTAEQIANARAKFNLDKPLIVQYFIWLKGVISGDFGISYKYQTSVLSSIISRAPITLGLVIGGSILSVCAAIPLGVFSAVKKNSGTDRVISIISLFLSAVPPFLVSIIIVLILSKVAPSFPITGGYVGAGGYIQRIMFPCIALALARITIILRITRSGMVEQLESPYVETAIAKGLPEKTVVFKHALKHAIIPVLSILSIQVGAMIVGAVLVESVFSLSGVGTLLIDSIKSSDYPVVQAIILMLVAIFLISSTIADVLYAAIDPRIRAKSREKVKA